MMAEYVDLQLLAVNSC